MDYIGIDLHKKESQICILREGGQLSECRIRTEPGRFAEVLGGRPRARILLEASTESEWVARCLEGLGHEVIVADPNFAPMYATRTRKVKTDRRDARALQEACLLGAYRPAHRLSDAQRHVRGRLRGARCLGPDAHRLHRPDPGSPAPPRVARAHGERGHVHPARRGAAAAGPPALGGGALAGGDAARQSSARILGRGDRARHAPRCARAAPAHRPAAFVATIDDAGRFHRAHEVEAYLGLVPRELSSGESQRRGRITKAGNTRMRWLLVQAAVSILRLRDPRTVALRRWAMGIATRRGKKIAVVALARRLAGLLYAMLRDGTTYEPRAVPRGATAVAVPV
jgi:transposase